MNNLTNSLVITSLGMGLVFLMIILLWGLMVILVSLLHRNESQSSGELGISPQETYQKMMAAAAAVAIALSHEGIPEPHEFPLPPTALVSAWQAVMRTEMLKKRGPKR